MTPDGDVTRLLTKARAGNQHAAHRAFELLYSEMRPRVAPPDGARHNARRERETPASWGIAARWSTPPWVMLAKNVVSGPSCAHWGLRHLNGYGVNTWVQRFSDGEGHRHSEFQDASLRFVLYGSSCVICAICAICAGPHPA